MNIVIYTIKNCSSCKQAKEYLLKHGVEFTEIDMSIGGIKEVQQMKKQFKEWGLKVYPVILIDKKVILQGYDKKEFEEVFGK